MERNKTELEVVRMLDEVEEFVVKNIELYEMKEAEEVREYVLNLIELNVEKGLKIIEWLVNIGGIDMKDKLEFKWYLDVFNTYMEVLDRVEDERKKLSSFSFETWDDFLTDMMFNDLERYKYYCAEERDWCFEDEVNLTKSEMKKVNEIIGDTIHRHKRGE